ncbi:unnamed protein product [Durusdinium trenchii]|uniref:Uncharacterized protein n=1 Tax=Durusdinium trenchii TaxID=1381693 RepID=A0ABP0MXU5_9DINO
MLILEFHPRGLLVKGETYAARECLKALEGRWDSSLKAWVYEHRRKREVLEKLTQLGLELQDHAQAQRVPACAALGGVVELSWCGCLFLFGVAWELPGGI